MRVHAAGICGSDREVYQGNRPEGYVRYPLTPGHEWSGTVAAVGDGAPAGLVGRKVVGEGFRNCQVCDRCHAGETTLCTAGYEETGFTRPGAMAPTLTLPARLLHPAGRRRPHRRRPAGPAACIAAAALKARAVPGEGRGGRDRHAGDVRGAVPEGRLARRAAGGGHPGRPGGAVAAVRGHGLPYQGPAAPGRRGRGDRDGGVRRRGPYRGRTAPRGGRLVLTGIPAPGADGLDPTDLVVRQLEVHTVFGAPPDAWAHTVRMFGAGLLDPLPLVTHELPLAAFPDAIELVGSGDPKVGKVLLRP